MGGQLLQNIKVQEVQILIEHGAFIATPSGRTAHWAMAGLHWKASFRQTRNQRPMIKRQLD